MAYFADLTPYVYFKETEPFLNVGWLDVSVPYPLGPVPEGFVEALRALPKSKHTRGWHNCPLCVRGEGRLRQWANGTCEIRVRHGGAAYAAPELIVHYVEAHGYQPPAAFVEAVLHGEPVLSD